MKKEVKIKFRPPTKNKSQFSTPSPPIISLGKEEKELLKFMSNQRRLNVNGYSDSHNISRSTTRSRLKKLAKLNLIKDNFAEKKITKQGLIYLENTNQIEKQGVESSRQGGRKEQLSTHWHKFKLPIENKNKFKIESLNKLNPIEIKENKLRNLHQIIISFDEAKIIINPKQVIISLFDVVTDNIEDSDIKCLDRALEYAQQLRKLGLQTSGIMVEEGHWARMESHLADWLYKNFDGKYYLELEEGKKFWIDCSGRKSPEDETNDKLVRQRIDNFMGQIMSNDFDLQDINKIKESLGFITKLETIRLQDLIKENDLKKLQLENKMTNNFIETKFNDYIN